MISVALTQYYQGGEKTFWMHMPQAPIVGDMVHFTYTDDPDDSRPWQVIHVAWVLEIEEWHAEVGLQ